MYPARSFHVRENEISSFTRNYLAQSDSSLQVMIEGSNACHTHGADPECLTSHCFTHGGSTMSNLGQKHPVLSHFTQDVSGT